MDYVVTASAFSIAALLFWTLVCNLKTYKEITALLHKVSGLAQQQILEGRSWRDVHDLFDRVSYFEFMFALMTFRDPIKLYPKELIDELSSE